MNALTSGTRAYLERRLEALLEDEDESIPATDRLEQVPFDTYVKLLRRGPLLEAYPAKPSKLDLRVSKTRSSPATSAELTQMAAVFHQNQQDHFPTHQTMAAVASQAPAAPSTANWDALLTAAAQSVPNSYAEDPFTAIIGVATAMQASRQDCLQKADTTGVRNLDTAATELT